MSPENPLIFYGSGGFDGVLYIWSFKKTDSQTEGSGSNEEDKGEHDDDIKSEEWKEIGKADDPFWSDFSLLVNKKEEEKDAEREEKLTFDKERSGSFHPDLKETPEQAQKEEDRKAASPPKQTSKAEVSRYENPFAARS